MEQVAERHGVVTRAELTSAELSADQIDHLSANGPAHRQRRRRLSNRGGAGLVRVAGHRRDPRHRGRVMGIAPHGGEALGHPGAGSRAQHRADTTVRAQRQPPRRDCASLDARVSVARDIDPADTGHDPGPDALRSGTNDRPCSTRPRGRGRLERPAMHDRRPAPSACRTGWSGPTRHPANAFHPGVTRRRLRSHLERPGRPGESRARISSRHCMGGADVRRGGVHPKGRWPGSIGTSGDRIRREQVPWPAVGRGP